LRNHLSLWVRALKERRCRAYPSVRSLSLLQTARPASVRRYRFVKYLGFMAGVWSNSNKPASLSSSSPSLASLSKAARAWPAAHTVLSRSSRFFRTSYLPEREKNFNSAQKSRCSYGTRGVSRGQKMRTHPRAARKRRFVLTDPSRAAIAGSSRTWFSN